MSKFPKITFLTPKLQTSTVGNIFDRRDPKKLPLNFLFPTKWYPCLHISLFTPVLYIKKSILNTTEKNFVQKRKIKFLPSEGSRWITKEHLLEAVDGRGKTEAAEFAAALARATAANSKSSRTYYEVLLFSGSRQK